MDSSRGLPLILGWMVASCAALFAAHAAAQPGFSKERLAELQRLQSDPGLKRAEKQWNRASREATRNHLRGLAAAGEPRELMAAAMLWQANAETDPADAAVPRIAQETRTWFDAARQARPRDVLVAWVEASDCSGLSERCDPQAALDFLLQAEPHNAAVQLLALARADKRGDRAAVERYWLAAAEALFYEPHTLEIGRLLGTAMDGVPQPPLDWKLAGAMGLAFGLNRPLAAQEVADIGAIGMMAALTLPAFAPVTQRCKPDQLATAAPGRKGQCEKILGFFAEDQSTLLAPMIGLTHLVRLAGDTAEGSAWRERLRQFYWVYESALQRLPSLSPGSAMPSGYGKRFLAEGELSAMRQLLERDGLPPTPPGDWLPREPRYRALVTTGHDPQA